MQMRLTRMTAMLALGVAILSGCGGHNRPPYLSPAPSSTAGDTLALTSGNRIVSFNRSNPTVRTTVQVTGLQAGENLLGIDTRPGGTPAGELYALGSSGRVYVLNTSSGAATLKATLTADPSDTTDIFTTFSGTEFGIDFNPVPDRLRVVSNTGQNLRINVDTGGVITDGALNSTGSVLSGISAAAYTNSFAAACRTTLYYLDTVTDRLLTTTDPNNGVVNAVGALGIDAQASSGLEIVTANDGSNSAIAALTVAGVTRLYNINLSSGAASSVGAITDLGNETIRGLAIAPLTTTPMQAAGDVLALTDGNRLLSFTNGAPQKLCTNTAITGLQSNENLLGMDVRPADAALYALSSTGRLYIVDRATGTATLKSTLAADTADVSDPFTALSGSNFGVDFNPVPDRLRVVSDLGQNLRVNIDTGATTTDTALNPAGSTITAAAYTNSFAGAGSTTLYVLDVSNDRLMIQGQPSGNPNNGDLLSIGALGLAADVQSAGGFDINARNATAYAALNLSGISNSELYTINLATGVATRVNTIGGGERIRGLALAAAAQANVLAVTSTQHLVSFKPSSPGVFDSDLVITGLQGGENIVALDLRPSNSRLYALTDAGRLYTLDPLNAAASVAVALSADSGDASNPFTTLSGSAFGLDFNPVVDRLRIVSNATQNLRVNVDSGATLTDTNLTPATATVVAAAYTRNFAGTTSTSLLVIDLSTNSLQLQNPPNDGVLTSIGLLDPSLTFTNIASFDIAGGDDGLALAVLQPTAALQSSLYRINLRTGAATAVGSVGPSGAPLIQAAAIRLQ